MQSSCSTLSTTPYYGRVLVGRSHGTIPITVQKAKRTELLETKNKKKT